MKLPRRPGNHIGWQGGILLVGLLCALAPCAPAQVGTKGARLFCEAPTFDFGTRKNTEDLQHEFILQNQGSAPLTITQVRSGCGCTRTELSRYTIPPGGTATLKTWLTIRNHVGLKHVNLYLHSSDPLNPVFPCRIVVRAVAELDLSPTAFRFEVPAGAAVLPSSSLGIRNNTDIPLHPLAVEVKAPFCGISLVTNVLGRHYTLTATLIDATLAAKATGSIVIQTDHPRYPRIEIPVSAVIIRDLTARPDELVLREIPEGQPQESRYLVVQSSSNQPFQVVSVEAVPPGLPVTLHSLKPGWARIKAGPVRPTAALNGTIIRIHTDLERQPMVDVPVRVVKP